MTSDMTAKERAAETRKLVAPYIEHEQVVDCLEKIVTKAIRQAEAAAAAKAREEEREACALLVEGYTPKSHPITGAILSETAKAIRARADDEQRKVKALGDKKKPRGCPGL